MKKLCLSFFLLLSTIVFSQQDAWIYFNAKPNSQFYFDSPLEMLSQRALDRRLNQNIALDTKDIPIDLSYIRQVKSVEGITVMAQSKWMNAIHVRGNSALINSLKSLAFVDKVEFADASLNQAGKIANAFKIKKQDKIEDIEINYAYGSSENQIQMLNGHYLHQQNYTGSGKIIAVLDAGFPGVNTAEPFKKLRDTNQILGGYDFVRRNADFYTGDRHGTMVLSSMGGCKENALIGTAPEASYYLFITEDNSSENPVEESLWVEAAEKADSLGVDIINTSLGYFDYDNTAYSHTYSQMNGATAFMSKGAEIAFSRGMIVVVSAGNEGATDNPHIAVPADAPSVITVGAVAPTQTKASFSSIGPSFDGRIKPDIMAQGVATVVSDQFGNIVTANGSSFSSPIMAGMIACLWQAFPNKTNGELRDLIVQSADRYHQPNTEYGYGIPDFSLALINGVSENSLAKKYFSAYPNPTDNLVSVYFPENFNKGKVIIYSLLGKKVLEKSFTNPLESISLETLSSGIYIYKIETDAFSKSGKIIKN